MERIEITITPEMMAHLMTECRPEYFLKDLVMDNEATQVGRVVWSAEKTGEVSRYGILWLGTETIDEMTSEQIRPYYMPPTIEVE